MGVVSGNASMSRKRSDSPPTAANTTTARMTTKRCRSEKSMIQFNTAAVLRFPYFASMRLVAVRTAATGSQIAFEQLRLQHDAVLAGDYFPGNETSNDLRQVSFLHPGTHRTHMK